MEKNIKSTNDFNQLTKHQAGARRASKAGWRQRLPANYIYRLRTCDDGPRADCLHRIPEDFHSQMIASQHLPEKCCRVLCTPGDFVKPLMTT